jgi:RNA ligase
MKISEIMDYDRLLDRIHSGHVRVRKHPADSGLLILNYTEKAQYERVWDDVTKQCRGLIVQVADGGRPQDALVVARPWPKFFNLGERDDLNGVGLGTPVEAYDKMDGSLGILYPAPDGDYAIATRGSFESDQAIHATEVFRERYADYFAPNPRLTYLFEIVYPENRIVLDYGDLDDLVLLGVRYTATGQNLALDAPWKWPGTIVESLPAKTLGAALILPDRKNAEGMVLHLPGNDMVKIKQEDYVRLHKLVTGLNERAVWEHLAANEGRIDQLLMVIPDEFHAWTQKVADDLLDRFEEIQGRVHAAYHEIVGVLAEGPLYGMEGEREYRKAFADMAREHTPLNGALFQMLDGRDISDGIWKTLRPRGDSKSLLNRSEDNS